ENKLLNPKIRVSHFVGLGTLHEEQMASYCVLQMETYKRKESTSQSVLLLETYKSKKV
ncbi:hypothetical protein CHS0354_041658, partial [Potamilus streckersoni]